MKSRIAARAKCLPVHPLAGKPGSACGASAGGSLCIALAAPEEWLAKAVGRVGKVLARA